MNREDTIKRIEEVAIPLIAESGLELVDIEFKHESGSWVLRVYIDKNGGVNIHDCAELSRELGVLLDVTDVIHQSYNLEVSSPGLDRVLKKREDYVRFKGKKIRVKTIEPIEDRRNFVGFIEDLKNDILVLKGSEEERWRVPFEKIKKARLIVEI